jgi:hypothetical protein
MAIERGEFLTYLRGSSLFLGLQDLDLDRIIPFFTEEDIQDGTLVYNLGEEAGSLYLLYSGSVKLIKPGSEKPIAILQIGDVFGIEALRIWQRRLTSARAVGLVKILRIGMTALHNLIRIMPILSPRMQIRADSFKLMLKTKFSWMNQDETLYLVSHIHPIFLLKMLALPGTLLLLDISICLWAFLQAPTTNFMLPLGILFLVFTVWLIWNYVDWANDYSIVTNQRVVFQERIVGIYFNRSEAFLSAIRSVDLKTSLWGNYLGYSDVIVHTYAGQVVLQRLLYAREAMQFLDEQRRRMLAVQSHREKEDFQTYLRQRIRPPQTTEQPVSVSESGVVIPLVTGNPKPIITPRNPFPYQMRYEEGTKITYRTHIIFLIAKVWWVVFILATIPILSLYGWFTFPNVFASAALWNVLMIPIMFIYLVLGGLYLYRSEDWHNDTYTITENQFIDRTKKPLGREETRIASMNNIEAIRFVQKGILSLIFNYGTVYLRVGQIELSFDNVFSPSDVQRDIYRRIVEREQKQQQERVMQERERMLDWMESYNEITNEDEQDQSNL